MLHFRFHINLHKVKNYDLEGIPMQKLEDQVSESLKLNHKGGRLHVCTNICEEFKEQEVYI